MTLESYILSDENIYLAIYAAKSYVFDPQLLCKEDREMLNRLQDPFNEALIDQTIRNIKQILKSALKDKDYFFKVQVYYKPKDYNDEDKKIVFRPIHTADLLQLIAMVAMLYPLIYEIPNEDNGWKLNLSNYSRLIPNNFYGNRVSKDPEELFKKWNRQYKKYSKAANEYFKTYRASGEYKYELKLDLEQFFPSVDPLLVYRILMENMPVTVGDKDVVTFKRIIYKLLICEVTNLENDLAKELYYGHSSVNIHFTKGIAQGLPQSYFFGNVCMIEIAQIFERFFKGKSVYYVDDSYIYTNDLEKEEDFEKMLLNINREISKISRIKIEEAKKDRFISTKKRYFSFFRMLMVNGSFPYEVKVHTGMKSTLTKIMDAKEGEVYLKTLSREASQIGSDISSAYSDEEEVTMLHKTEALLNSIAKELSSEQEERSGYKDKLTRYYKFFKYRAIRLRLKTETKLNRDLLEALVGNLEEENIGDPEKAVEILERGVDVETFTNLYKNDIWQVALSIMIENSLLDQEVIQAYLYQVLDEVYDKALKKNSYIYQMYENYLNDEEIEITPNAYETLDKQTKRRMVRYSNMHSAVLKKEITGVRLNLLEENVLTSFHICSSEFMETCKIVNSNSNRLQRMFLNAVYSKIFKVKVSDEIILGSYDKKGISYGALRVLAYLRNTHCNIEQFFKWSIDIMSPENLQKVDYSLFEVLGAYKKYVVLPENIDDLIQVHKYTCDVWKNGAKHLYFYTLHNQEHAVDLVKNIIKIIKTFSYLQITGYDYYLLFIACYLHDISMVRIASDSDFLLDRQKADGIVSEIEEQWRDSKSLEDIKKAIIKSYKELDRFFEDKIRSKHAQESAEEIRNRGELDFLEPSVKENVAEIAESHMLDVRDIYFVKGNAKNQLISYKFDKILLRFADLLDMSEHRVSRPILNHNMDNISPISAFHWVSHLLTDGYTLTSEYAGREEGMDYLAPGSIEENVTLSIYVNLSQFSKMKAANCKAARLVDETVKKGGFELELLPVGEKKCESEHCNFLCRWFNKKNYYLVEEMQALEAYLGRVPAKERFYKTKIKIKVVVLKPTHLSDEQFETLKKQVFY